MADVEQEAPLVAGEWMASKSTSRRGMVIASAVTLLLASSLSVTAGYVYLHREQFKAVTNAHGPSMEEHSKLPFPDKRDIQDLLNVFQDMFPDGSVFKEVKYLDIDNSDPSNIKSKPKHVVHPNVTMQKLRMLQEETPVMDLSYMQQLNIGMCAIDAYQSALTIGQIATNIHALVDACKSPYPQNPEQQDFCGGLVSLNLALWGYLACFIEDMVSSCGPEFNLNAGCSLDVTGLLTNSFLAASAGAGMKQNCLPPGGYKETTPPPITADPALRRDFTKKELALLKKIVEKLRESEAFQATQSRDRQKRNFAIGAGTRRLEEFTELPGAPFEKQKADLESDAEYLKKRANELLQKIGGQNGDEEIEEPTPEV
ncbi:unnamed protein product [Durusdinium trenchii]|uniref:Transmembrane protein n=2 Tax=Durusdinium trenchii TaxID=1381693 RepID=A0ABP0QM18_9DINO